MAEVDREWLASELRRLLLAVASPGEAALEHAPAGSCRPDELALDHENFARALVAAFASELSDPQRRALLHVDELLGAMSGPHQAELWTEAAVVGQPRWAEVRRAAQQALDALSWRPA
ncbi:MAG TPA: hypothetical protein VF530_11755 [Planctomycetota bacterium]